MHEDASRLATIRRMQKWHKPVESDNRVKVLMADHGPGMSRSTPTPYEFLSFFLKKKDKK